MLATKKVPAVVIVTKKIIIKEAVTKKETIIIKEVVTEALRLILGTTGLHLCIVK
jgi:hypothetical protein